MTMPRYIVYFVTMGDKVCLGLSPDPAFDWRYWQSLGCASFPRQLAPPLPLFAAQKLLAALTKRPFIPNKISFFGRLALAWRARKFTPQPAPESRAVADDLLRRLLAGRIYLWEELERLWREDDLSLAVQKLVLEGKCLLTAAVGLDSWGRLVCRRCGGSNLEPNRWCCPGQICVECTECSALGKASTCKGLVAMAREGDDPPRRVRLQLPFALTKAQSTASRQLAEFVRSEKSTLLLWAVCGAGKTEVSFQAAQIVLAQGGRVLLAVPRRSVVRELAGRLEGAFPNLSLQVLYGGVDREQRRRSSPLVLATTHQVLRFYRNFDLVILDEADAFPYRGSRMLQQAAERALRPGGKRIFMTATPDRALLKKVRVENWSLARLPVRHHGRPLPVPAVLLSALKEEPLELPEQVLAQIQSSRSLFIFVPTVALCLKVAQHLRQRMGEVESCHAQDPERDKKLAAFRRGEVRYLVSTTVAERGITIPGVDVLVLFANHQLFDERALVQMAGRAGRTAAQPTGEVCFAAVSQSTAMTEAIRQIREQNLEAARLGLIAA